VQPQPDEIELTCRNECATGTEKAGKTKAGVGFGNRRAQCEFHWPDGRLQLCLQLGARGAGRGCGGVAACSSHNASTPPGDDGALGRAGHAGLGSKLITYGVADYCTVQ